MIDDQQAVTNIANNVRLLLRERSMTQSALAELTGEPMMNISRVVNAKNLAGVGTLARIAEALRTTVDWLLADHSQETLRSA